MRTLLIAALALAGCGKSKCAVFADLESRCTAEQLMLDTSQVTDVVHDNALEACVDPSRTPELARNLVLGAGAPDLDTMIACAQRTTDCAAYRACYERR